MLGLRRSDGIHRWLSGDVQVVQEIQRNCNNCARWITPNIVCWDSPFEQDDVLKPSSSANWTLNNCAHRVCGSRLASHQVLFRVLCTDLLSNVSTSNDSEEIVWPRVCLQKQPHSEVAHVTVQVSDFQQNAHTRAFGSARLHSSLFFHRCLSPPLDWPRSVGLLLAHDRSRGLVRAGQVAHCRQVEAQCVFEAPYLPRRDIEK